MKYIFWKIIEIVTFHIYEATSSIYTKINFIFMNHWHKHYKN
jgi:hypothetical protein